MNISIRMSHRTSDTVQPKLNSSLFIDGLISFPINSMLVCIKGCRLRLDHLIDPSLTMSGARTNMANVTEWD